MTGIPASAKVALRPLQPSDAERVHALLSNWVVVRHMLFPLCSREESEGFVRDAVSESNAGSWRSIVRAVADASSLVGLCGIAILPGSEEGEIWYLVDPDCWGRGIATAAAEALLRMGFTELGLHRMWASCLPENPASVKVLEKLGMRCEGLRRQNLKIHGQWRDSFVYAILREEWLRAAGH